MGLTSAQLADLGEALQGADEGGGIWPDNVAIVEAFLAVSTQWRTGTRPQGFGASTLWIGLDYGAVRVGLEALGTAITPELWAGLLIMEGAAADALNELGDR